MKRKSILFLVVGFIMYLQVNVVVATPGRVRKASIKSCNGQIYGIHGSNGNDHWHLAQQNPDGNYSALGQPLSGEPCKAVEQKSEEKPSNTVPPKIDQQKETPVAAVPAKSDNNILGSIKVGQIDMKIADVMYETTTQSQAKITALPQDANAKIEYQEMVDLIIGENTVPIKIISESGKIKEYILLITREPQLSDNTNINYIKINNETASLVDANTYELHVDHEVSNADFEIYLDDINSTVEILDNGKLEVGNNWVRVVVTAENEYKTEYIINIKREANDELGAIETIGAGGVLAGVGYLVYRVTNNKRKQSHPSL